MYDYTPTPRRPIGRWLIALAVLSILTVVVAVAINLGGANRASSRCDVRGQISADATAALQNKGFKVRTQQKPDSTVAPITSSVPNRPATPRLRPARRSCSTCPPGRSNARFPT